MIRHSLNNSISRSYSTRKNLVRKFSSWPLCWVLVCMFKMSEDFPYLFPAINIAGLTFLLRSPALRLYKCVSLTCRALSFGCISLVSSSSSDKSSADSTASKNSTSSSEAVTQENAKLVTGQLWYENILATHFIDLRGLNCTIHNLKLYLRKPGLPNRRSICLLSLLISDILNGKVLRFTTESFSCRMPLRTCAHTCTRVKQNKVTCNCLTLDTWHAYLRFCDLHVL